MDAKRANPYWAHIRSWWPHRNEPEVLFLCYEDMKQHLPLTISRIAAFIDCLLDDELFNIVLHQSSVEFMREHKQHFDDHLIRTKRDAVCGLPPGGDSSKVRTGNVGDHARELPPEIIAVLDRLWKEEIEATLGFHSYGDRRCALGR